MSKFIELSVITTDKNGNDEIQPPELFNTDSIYCLYKHASGNGSMICFKRGSVLRDLHHYYVAESYDDIKTLLKD